MEKPWPSDAMAVLVLLDDHAEPRFQAPQIVLPGETAFVELVADEKRQVVAVAYEAGLRATDGRPLDECGVSLEGPGRVLSPVLGEWRSALFDAQGSDQFVLERLPAGEHVSVEPREALCDGAIDPCRGLTFEEPIAGCPATFYAVVAESETVAYGLHVAGAVGAITRVEPSGCSTLVESTTLLRALSLAQSGPDTFLAGAVTTTATGTDILKIDLASSSVERTLNLDALVPYLDRGDDGSLVLFGDGGVHRLSSDGRTAIRDPSVASEIKVLDVVGSDRMVMVDAHDTLHFFDGQRWTPEWSRPVVGAIRLRLTAGSADHFYGAGVNGGLIERNEINREWAEVQVPTALTGGSDFIQGAVLSDGRPLLTGSRGLVIAGDRNGWCELEKNGSPDRFDHLAMAPNGRAAFLFSTSSVRRVTFAGR